MFNLVYIMLNIVIVLIVYSILRFRYLKKKKTNISWFREFLIAGFIAYTTGMIILLFFHFYAGFSIFTDKGFFNPIERIKNNVGVNFIPFKSISDFINYSVSPSVMIRNIFGNIFLFTPIGILMTLLWERWQRPKNMILFSIIIPICIEFIQLFIGRAVDVDDVILNFTGLMIGFFISKLFIKLFPNYYNRYLSTNPQEKANFQ